MREGEKERKRKRERKGERVREKERKREREGGRERETERERDCLCMNCIYIQICIQHARVARQAMTRLYVCKRERGEGGGEREEWR